jgi:hypothetical protein
MIKKIVILTILIFIFHLCSAPNLSDILKESQKKYVISEMKRWAWEKEFNRWKEDLGFKESGGDWTKYNKIGCIGTYQFRVATLECLGFKGITFNKFKTNPEIFSPELQEEALRALIRANELALKQFEQYIGQTIGGVLITRSGLLAAAHLGGIGGVKKFLENNKNPLDSNGTSIGDYLQKFHRYNI